MKSSINRAKKEDFVDEFILAYKSPGISIPFIRMAYGRAFEIVELRNMYRVSIRGTVKRYSNIFEVAQFIYDQNFDPMHIYVAPRTDKQKLKIARKKKLFSRMLSCLCLGRNNSFGQLRAA